MPRAAETRATLSRAFRAAQMKLTRAFTAGGMPVGSRALVIILPTMGHASANRAMKLTPDPSMAVTERYRRRRPHSDQCLVVTSLQRSRP
jgi:hypothetical protein